MKIMIAGGAGYIGSVLIPKLISRGHEITVVDLLWFGNHLPESVTVKKMDILALTHEDMLGFDQVIFLAGVSNDPMAEFSPGLNYIHNAAAPALLAYLAKGANVRRFIYAGSCSVYGYTEDELYSESSPAISSFPYGISKLQGEKASLQLMDDNFSVIAFRQGTVNGYSPRMRLDLVINTMFAAARSSGVLKVNNPAIWRPILSIEDAAEAYICAVDAPMDISGIFNISSGNYTVGEIGNAVVEVIKERLGEETKMEINHIVDLRNYKVSTKKASEKLGFTANHGVANIVENLIDNMDHFSDYANREYYNIRVFKDVVGLG